jgi:epoxyqueuosine reductase
VIVTSLDESIERAAKDLGIVLVGYSSIERTEYSRIVQDRIERGLIPKKIIQATDCFKNPDVYSDPARSMAGAKTLICVGGPYLESKARPNDFKSHGAIGRHYWRDSYTDLEAKRNALIDWLKGQGLDAVPAKVHPREAAFETGLAWIGRSALAINPTYGSWVLYYSLVTDAFLAPSERISKSCPKGCRRCMDSCPTKALIEPYTLDVSRCLNFILEDTGTIPEWARDGVGNKINGCDVCQEACPMNSKVKPAPQPLTASEPNPGLVPFPELERCFSVTEDEMKANYGYMDWFEPTTRYLKRNALIAVGNSADHDLSKTAARFLDSKDQILRNHARWAKDRLR